MSGLRAIGSTDEKGSERSSMIWRRAANETVRKEKRTRTAVSESIEPPATTAARMTKQSTSATINPKIVTYNSAQKTNEVGSVDDAKLLQAMCSKHGPFDVILDDASHWNKHQIHAFGSLYPCVKPGGVYMVEDINTSFKPFPPWGNAKTLTSASFLHFAQRKIFELEAWWSCGDSFSVVSRADGTCGCNARNRCREAGQSTYHKVTNFTRTTTGIHFHDGIVVFDKALAPRTPAVAVSAGDWADANVGSDFRKGLG